MKKTIMIAISVFICFCVFLGGCATTFEKSPEQYKKVRWETPDYKFYFYTDNDCKGIYRFNEKTYNIKVDFDGSYITVKDTDNKNTELFNGQWLYDEDQLYIYDIQFNKKNYKSFKENYAEYVKLQKRNVK